MTTSIHPAIASFIENLKIENIPDQRKVILNEIVAYLNTKVANQVSTRLIFICTHNSRRSHLCQVWAQTFANYFGLPSFYSYSGGTEVTALYPKIADVLQQVGFKIQKLAITDNPIYSIKYGVNEPPIIGFSKKLDASFNPSSNFGAVLTCSSAEEACPIVLGAEQRIFLPFEDPKAFDETEQQEKMYHQCNQQIATELKYVFQQIDKPHEQ